MEGIVKLMGIVMVAIGVIYFVKPATMKKIADYFLKEQRLKIGGVISIIIGVIFLGTASKCAIPLVVTLFGILALAKGIVIFALGQQKIKTMLDTLTKKTPKTIRGFALIEIILGIVLIYAV